jgi:uncharacterized protein YjiS (DUF1127 family)
MVQDEDETMTGLVSTLADGTVQIWQATAVAGTALAIRLIGSGKPRRQNARLDPRTLADIGVERGSITWMR